MIIVKAISNLFSEALQKQHNREKLTTGDIEFLTLMDEATTISFITDALNLVLEGNDLNKYKIPVLIKLLYQICKKVETISSIENVSVPNVIEFILIAIVESGIIKMDIMETIIIKEIIENSIFLLTTDSGTVKNKRRWYKWGCLG